MNEKYFSLFAHCIPVKGKERSLIYDLGRASLINIDNILCDVLFMSQKMSIPQLKAFYKGRFNEGIDKYFSLFVQEEIGFITESPEQFPPLNLQWDSPFYIQNAILEDAGKYNLLEVLRELDLLDTRNVQLRIFSGSNISMDTLGAFLKETSFHNIEIYLPFEIEQIDAIKALFQEEKAISVIYVYGATYTSKDKEYNLFYIEKPLNPSQIEVITESAFFPNIEVFSESQSYNTALNRKICIDQEGNIKNFLSHSKAFGKIGEDSIKAVYEEEGFREKWHVTKDEISNCKHCKYRYACVYNADLLPKGGDLWELATPCNFDPHQDTWLA